MAVTRRALMIGGGAVGLAALGISGYVFTRTPSDALEPWQEAGDEAYQRDPRLFALSYAILAPNPHNMQPWRVVLERDDSLTLYCDLNKRLPETDPFDRQTTIGLGCFLELLRLASAENNYRAEITPFPEGAPEPNLDDRPIATVTFTADSSLVHNPIFDRVYYRRSSKEVFDTRRTVYQAALDDLISKTENPGWTHASSENTLRQNLRQLTWESFKTELATPGPWRESVDVMRIGKSEVNANPDGIALTGLGIDIGATLGMISREALLDPSSDAYQEGLDRFEPVFMSGMAYLWQITPDNSRFSQLAAGRDWLRLNLEGAAIDLSMQPVSQALQEYAAQDDHREALNRLLGVPEGARLQMLGRLGYGKTPAPSPRWPVSHILEEQPA
ncbi:MAG: twin-arginine translocation pathway signal protein [Pseudomonadota bacterium]